MNEQKSDSVSQEAISSSSEPSQTTPLTTKEHKSVLDSITKLWHKKHIESTSQTPGHHTETPTPVNTPSPVTVPEASQIPIPSQEPHMSISEKIAHIFHKKPPEKHTETPEVVSIAESVPTPTTDAPKEVETPVVMDERFARLLQHDSTYHSMIRSEDIKKIQLQLSLRYMALMLAIFVVIAWVVNNRVIMF